MFPSRWASRCRDRDEGRRAGTARAPEGDHVVLSAIPSCGNCRWCMTGRQNLCNPGCRDPRKPALDRRHVPAASSRTARRWVSTAGSPRSSRITTVSVDSG
ncbi:alcohol dehydrogenase catalytic domain-containing protein [Pseudonocardia sp. MCCB 268]|nr:alcohol dehydrogenase catalytic domain-containing protein [Pseudonocardia cytotoxica]